MTNLKTIEDMVKAILICNEKARDDDMTLYVCICNCCVRDAGSLSLSTVMLQYRELDIPNFESVGRIRRKVQAKYPELAASTEVKKRRAAQERVYRNYSKKE